MTYAQILSGLDSERLAALPRMKLAVLRHVVVEAIVPHVRHLAKRIGLNAEVRFGGYDNVYQEAVGGDAGLLNSEMDCALVFCDWKPCPGI
jgi:hypothetical protein